MSTHLFCPTCLRREVWTGAQHDVLQEGGSRRPAVPPVLAAWDTLQRHSPSGEAIRGTCVCGQPLLSEGEVEASHPTIPWVLDLPDGGAITIDGSFTGPDGQPITSAAITTLLEAAYPRVQREPLGTRLFQFFTLTPVILAIFTLWLMSATVMTMMLKALGTPLGS